MKKLEFRILFGARGKDKLLGELNKDDTLRHSVYSQLKLFIQASWKHIQVFGRPRCGPYCPKHKAF